jgi:hypothetical protein
VTVTATRAKVGRPKSPLDLADSRELARIASLASSVLMSLRKPGRGQYDSERTLRQWLSDDGIQFSAADLAHALVLLDSTGKIGRGPENKNSPRVGWLIGAADKPVWSSDGAGGDTVLDNEPAEPVEAVTAPTEPLTETPEPTDEQRIAALAESINKALIAGEGRTSRCENQAELVDRLVSDGVHFALEDVPAALAHLESSGRIRYGRAPQPSKFDRHPERPFVRRVPRFW